MCVIFKHGLHGTHDVLDLIVLTVRVAGGSGFSAPSDMSAPDGVQVATEGRQHQRQLQQDGQPRDVERVLKKQASC